MVNSGFYTGMPMKTRRVTQRNVTTVALSPLEFERFVRATEAYRLNSFAGFFRSCAQALIAHAEKGDVLLFPLFFRVQPKAPATDE